MRHSPFYCRLLAVLSLPLAGLGDVGRAHTPINVPIHAYYGPLRICDSLFAFDVRAGEGYLDDAWDRVVRFGGHYLSMGRRWIYADDSYRDIVRPLGTLDLPGVGRLERTELGSRSSEEKVIAYLYDTGDGGPFPKMEINSDAFDGSERDLALLNRIAFGAQARAMCADVPEAMRPRPEREDANAIWVRPDRPQGPLTLCWAGLALDLRAEETAILPWRRDWDRFGIAGDTWTVAVSGRFQTLQDRAGRPFEGPLAASPDFDVRESVPSIAALPPFTLGGPEATRYVQLSRRVDVPNLGIYLLPGVTFAFSGPVTSAEIADVIGRVRRWVPSDRCFDGDSL